MSRPTITIKSLDMSSSEEPAGTVLDPAQGGFLDFGEPEQGGASSRFALRLSVTDWNAEGTPGVNDYFRNIRVWVEKASLAADDVLIGFPATWADRNSVALSPAPTAPPVDAQLRPQANAPAGWNMTADPNGPVTQTSAMVLQFRKSACDYPRQAYGGTSGGLNICFNGEYS